MNKLRFLVFSITLLAGIPSYADRFSETLNALGVVPAVSNKDQTYSTPQLLICQANVNNFGKTSTLCGDGNGGGNNSNSESQNSWTSTRAILASGSRLPGVYQNIRAVEWNKKLDQAANQATYNLKSIKEEYQSYREGLKQYSKSVLGPSVKSGLLANAGLRSSVQKWHQQLQDVSSSTSATIGSTTDTALEAALSNVSRPQVLSQVKALVDELQSAEKHGDIRALTKKLDTLTRAASAGATILENADRDALKAVRDDWIRPDGLISSKHLTPEGQHLRDALSGQIKTAPDSESGAEIRHEVNRALLSLGSPNSNISGNSEKQSQTWGAVGLALAADQSYGDGANADGAELLRHAKQLIDFTLGLVPIIGGLNDLTQIVHGIVTGYDYTGQRMTKADYALRSIGVVISLLPAGNAALKIGNQIISEAFLDGARTIRNSGMGQELATAIRSAPEVAPTIAEGVGELLRSESSIQKTEDIRKLINELKSVEEGGGPAHLKLFSKILVDAKVDRFQRKGVITSFIAPELAEAQGGELYARWYDNEGAAQYGRYLSKEIIEDPEKARQLLAIPIENKMKILDTFELKKGALIVRGGVAELKPFPGGGTQIFIIDEPDTVLTLVKRLKP